MRKVLLPKMGDIVGYIRHVDEEGDGKYAVVPAIVIRDANKHGEVDLRILGGYSNRTHVIFKVPYVSEDKNQTFTWHWLPDREAIETFEVPD